MSLKTGWNEALGITAKWLAIGSIGYLFDWLSHKADHAPFHHTSGVLFYWVMPVIIGLPVAWVDSKLARRTAGLGFTLSLLVRAVIYIFFAALAGFLFLILHSEILRLHSVVWLVLKFMGFWLPASLFVLALRNLLKHFERENILTWIQGNYHAPSEEERIFLFVDIKDSTAIAESLGNKKYFEFIQMFHHLAADPIRRNKGEVYQFIGDEIVITWPLEKGTHHNRALSLFFDIENSLQLNSELFMHNFGRVPAIKGALHAGKVTRGEIGKDKKEFGYVGDVINTAARMQSVAKTTAGVSLVISQRLLKAFHDPRCYDPQPLGHHKLRGKNEQVSLYTLSAAKKDRSTAVTK